jgi:mono/diheme cytochrome c family protein
MSRTHWLVSSSLVLAALFALGCSKGEAPVGDAAKGPGASAAAITPAIRDTFKTTCAPCHGESGRGDGPGAVALNPKPRNYTDKEWQKKVSDEDIKKTILYGGAAVGKSPVMPASPQLDKPETLNGLVALIREFGK